MNPPMIVALVFYFTLTPVIISDEVPADIYSIEYTGKLSPKVERIKYEQQMWLHTLSTITDSKQDIFCSFDNTSCWSIEFFQPSHASGDEISRDIALYSHNLAGTANTVEAYCEVVVAEFPFSDDMKPIVNKTFHHIFHGDDHYLVKGAIDPRGLPEYFWINVYIYLDLKWMFAQDGPNFDVTRSARRRSEYSPSHYRDPGACGLQ